MAIVQNDSGLVAVQRPLLSGLAYGSINLYENRAISYAELYRRQPELRTVVDFLARAIQQVPIHAFERVSDTERNRISEGPLAATLERPDPTMTRTRWIGNVVRDLAIYDACYLVKVRSEGGRIALIRIPPETVELVGENWLRPDAYKIHGSAGTVEYPANAVIDIHGYNPGPDPRKGLSPIETLRRVLAEQDAAGEWRERYWLNSARMGGIIERPQTAPAWSDQARARFRQQFEDTYTGAQASGKTLVLEEGMVYKPVSFSARDSQFLESWQLSRELVCAAYGVPPGLILGQGTYSSLDMSHRQLYQDTLAPWLVMLSEELEVQLLPDFAVAENVYLEAAIQSKLAGSFQEQATILSSSVGAPFMTRNEARARLNLPPLPGESGDLIVTPLNVLIGDQASPQDSVSEERQLAGLAAAPELPGKAIEPDQAKALRRSRILEARRQAAKRLREEIAAAFRRQRRSVASRVGAKSATGVKASASDLFDRNRFRKELAEDMLPILKRAAKTMAGTVSREWDPENGENYLDEVANGFADAVTDATFDEIQDILEESPDELDPDVFDDLFDNLEETSAELYADDLSVSIGEWARSEAAAVLGVASKTWLVTSSNPRASHAALDGETVDRTGTFSNGARWPGDPALGVEERAQCACVVDFGV